MIEWLEGATIAVEELADLDTGRARAVLDRISSTQHGRLAAANTANRKAHSAQQAIMTRFGTLRVRTRPHFSYLISSAGMKFRWSKISPWVFLSSLLSASTVGLSSSIRAGARYCRRTSVSYSGNSTS